MTILRWLLSLLRDWLRSRLGPSYYTSVCGGVVVLGSLLLLFGRFMQGTEITDEQWAALWRTIAHWLEQAAPVLGIAGGVGLIRARDEERQP